MKRLFFTHCKCEIVIYNKVIRTIQIWYDKMELRMVKDLISYFKVI